MSRLLVLASLLSAACARTGLEAATDRPPSISLTLDPAFGDGGIFALPLPATDDLAQLGESAGTEILLCGAVHDGVVERGLLARVTADGRLDDSFHGNGDGVVSDGEGVALVSTHPTLTDFHTARPGRDGGYLVGGATGEPSGDAPNALVAEITRAGELDDRFNGNGDGTLSAGEGMISWTRTSWSHARVIWPEPDGSWRIIGAAIASGWRVMTAHLLASGALDPAYGVGGVVYGINEPESEIGWGLRATALPGGATLVSGFAPSGLEGRNFRLQRLLANGDLDDCYHGNCDGSFDSGEGVVDVSIGAQDFANDHLIQPDGRVLIAGSSAWLGVDHLSVARLTAAGDLDVEFNPAGALLGVPGTGVHPLWGKDAWANAVELQPDGKIVLVGQATPPQGDPMAVVVRLLADGTPDPCLGCPTCDGPGFAGVPELLRGNDARLLPDGRLLIVGQRRSPAGDLDVAVARLVL